MRCFPFGSARVKSVTSGRGQVAAVVTERELRFNVPAFRSTTSPSPGLLKRGTLPYRD
jgi:hypothetical protein